MPPPPTPKIVWGAGNEWVFPGPVDNPVPVPRPKVGIAESDAYRDSWVGPTQYELTVEARFVPSQTVGGVTGYNTVNGVQDALAYMYGNVASYYYNKDVASPKSVFLTNFEVARDGRGAYYRVKMTFKSADNTAFRSY